MPVLTSEAVVLRTWPVHEADLIVSFFTRDYGRMRGVAKAALKSRKRFGGALEPMTLARAWFAERPRQELVRLDQLEIVRSPLSAPVDHARMAVLSFYAEVLDEMLPERDPQDAVFRLLVSVLEQTAAVQRNQLVRAHKTRSCPTSSNSTVDGAHLFFALDDASDGPLARHWPLHGVRRSYCMQRRFRFRVPPMGFSAGCMRTVRRAGFRPTVGNWRSVCCARRRRPLPPSRGRASAVRICGASRCKRWSGIWSGSSRARRRWRG